MPSAAAIKPSSLVEDGALKDQIQRLWLAWTDEADADGLTDFYGLQTMAARAMFEAGECFFRFRPRRLEDGLRCRCSCRCSPPSTCRWPSARRCRTATRSSSASSSIGSGAGSPTTSIAPTLAMSASVVGARPSGCRPSRCCTCSTRSPRARSGACRGWRRRWSGSGCSTSTTMPSSTGRRSRRCSRAS